MKIADRAKKTKIIFLKWTLGVRFICYNTDIKQEQERIWKAPR